MRRILVAVSTTALLLLFSAGTAFAATSGAHFKSATDSVDSSGALVVSFDETGLGNGDINYTLTSDATATYACLNGGGNHPKAANKETTSGSLSTGGTFASKNGRVQASLSVGPVSAGTFTCPGGQTLVLASVSYSNIVLTDTNNSVSTTLPDISKTFFAV